MTNGMKSGSGSDPFADVDTGNGDQEEDTSEIETTDKDEESEPSETETSDGLPFIYSRSGVKQARDHTFQLHYLTETYQQEKRIQSEIENRLGEDIYKVDLREAAMKAAFENVDDIEAVLRDWGYDAD